jgi:ubiquinone/menaquinone biosynthesis C-methylase UbiE
MSFKGKKKFSKLRDCESGYALYASQYDEDRAYLNSFEEDKLILSLGDLKGKKVLDLGAGTGRLVPTIRNLGGTVSATDLSEEMLKVLKKEYPGVETKVADCEELPYEDDEFDTVVASFVIVHLADLRHCFDEVYRVLKDGGRFVLTNINQRKAPQLKLKNGEEIVIKSFYHRPLDVIKALEESFFQVEKEDYVYDGKAWVTQIIRAGK